MTETKFEIIEEDTLLALKNMKCGKFEMWISHGFSLLILAGWVLVVVVNQPPIALKAAILALYILKLGFDPSLLCKSRLEPVPEGIKRSLWLPFRKHVEVVPWESIKFGMVMEEQHRKKKKTYLSLCDQSGKLILITNPRQDEKIWPFIDRIRESGCPVHVVRNKNRLSKTAKAK